ncbi:hypothetical protein C6497_08650 [Candidatus Poribacteria bacterium]|nr:MAG: hypothetical protein C6497_08650 [Candidatus Poribacteria bacterium]
MAEQHYELAHVFADPTQTVNDARGAASRDLNTPYTFPNYTKVEWNKISDSLRQQIRVANGLLPEHEKSPLNAQIFGKIEREDYSVEKVYFEAFPGFLTTGNLYRPLGKTGPFPGIVNPHGHWGRGRIEDIERGSIPARCINFAKQGYIAFAYDMVGYNDSGKQMDHRYGGENEELWGLSAMALQLQNGIRAIDFLESLQDVDSERIGCTGASGGGSQTFILTAVDQRIKVSAPVNMISATMQGGCICENAPNLRLDISNLEIGALMAPRPLLLVSCTGDWTSKTPSVEYPAIKSIYSFFEAEDKIHQVQVDAEHNYNLASREAVYEWFAKWLLDVKDTSTYKEAPYKVESDEDFLAFADREIPSHSLKQDEILPAWIKRSAVAIDNTKPSNEKEHKKFTDEMGSALQHSLGLHIPKSSEIMLTEPKGAFPTSYQTNLSAQHLVIGRKGIGDAIPSILFRTEPLVGHDPVVVIVHPEGKAKMIDAESGEPLPIITDLISSDRKVLTIDVFGTGEHGEYERSEETGFFTTYNRTTAALRIQDILTTLLYYATRGDVSEVSLVGIGEAGLWGLLAAGFTNIKNVVVDAAQFDNNLDSSFLESLPIPSIRRVGDFRTAGTLITPRNLIIHNTGQSFNTSWIEDVYRSMGAEENLLVRKDKMEDDEIAGRIAEL